MRLLMFRVLLCVKEHVVYGRLVNSSYCTKQIVQLFFLILETKVDSVLNRNGNRERVYICDDLKTRAVRFIFCFDFAQSARGADAFENPDVSRTEPSELESATARPRATSFRSSGAPVEALRPPDRRACAPSAFGPRSRR